VRSLVVAMFAALQATQGLAADSKVTVEAERHGDSVEVRARATLSASAALAWEVLTDYEALPRFIPGMTRSSVRLRQGQRIVVEQSGEARYLFFSFPIEVRLEVTETPQSLVVSRAVSGNLRRMNGRYELQPDPSGNGLLLRYSGEIEPSFSLPPLIGIVALRRSVEEQFTAMVAEIERRAAALPRGK
jgi:ribosome-associated toxin RatA of RatAB toxin-antitoxin module